MSRVVTLKKTKADGNMPIGSKYEYSYVSMDRFQAEHRAWKAFSRDHSGERRESWELQPGGHSALEKAA